MAMLSIAVIVGVVMAALACRANIRFRGERRLPMQWRLTGQVNWTAPRPLALAFIPVLAMACLGFVAVMSLTSAPRAGQEHLVLPTFIGMGATLVAIQLLHLWLIARTVRRNAD